MKDLKNEAVSFADLWSIQESLLQSYRKLFISIELVILAISIFLFLNYENSILINSLLLLLGVGLIPVWKGVCNARANAVVFIHWLIQKHEAGETIIQPYTHFRQFQLDRTYEGMSVLQDERFQYLCRSKTRQRLDKTVPVLFLLVWVMLLALYLINYMY